MPLSKVIRNSVLAACGIAAVSVAGVEVYRRFGPSTYKRFRTMFGRTRVYQVADDDGAPVRLLEVGGIVQSGTYVDDERCYDLVFEYLKRYDIMFEMGIPVNRVLVLGCGGYDYPEHLIAHHPEVVVDAVEIDPSITDIARRYFFLDRLIEEFETESTGRLNLICDDARAYLERGDALYDAIVNDTCDAGEPVPSLVGPDAARAVCERLVDGGLYLTNIVSALEGERSAFLWEQVAILEDVFASVQVLPCATDSFSDEDNVIVVAQK
ncbi:MAG: fused MFS/spermidine synthase [Eggerthellaceae bacterium]|nr:fused MFS/spermidine synthase [Eggerthellaceae bacterium]